MESIGLHYTDQFLSENDESKLIDFLKDKDWTVEEKRKSLQYGKNVPIPSFLKEFVNKVSEKFGKMFNQVIISQNPKGHGVSSHIDNTKLFGDTIVMMFINDNCDMKFEKDNSNFIVPLKKNGILTLKGDSRYKWKHSILSYKKGFNKEKDKTWISLTFRESLI